MYKKILFATDFDDVGLYAANKAGQLAKLCNAELYLAHIIEPIPAYAYPGLTNFVEIEQTLYEQAEFEIVKLGKRLGVPKERHILKTGSIKSQILELADTLGIEVIITGSHGRHGLALLIASTANSILHGAKCDVLIVRKPEVDK